MRSDPLLALRQTAASIRRVRWVAIVLVIVQFAVYEPPAGVARLPFRPLPVLGLLVGTLVALQAASYATRAGSGTTLRRMGVAETVVDGAVVLAIVWLFAFDDTAALWALLIVPIAEAAYRFPRAGPVTAWAALGSGYAAIQIWAHGYYGQDFALLPSLTYRGAVLLVTAGLMGALARNMAAQTASAQQAHAQEADRAERLRTLADASRKVGALEPDAVLSAVADAVLTLGFDATTVCVLDGQQYTYAAAATRNLPAELITGAQPLSVGLTADAVAAGHTIVTDDYTNLPAAVPAITAALPDLHHAVAVPIWVDGRIAAVLLAGKRGRGVTISLAEVESIELLAAHAGGAFSNARRFAERRAFAGRLAHQAYHDPLTGLPNRTRFMEQLVRATGELASERTAGLMVLLVDIDRFNLVNENLGHLTGDQLLVKIAARLRAALPPHCVLARLGGDEFAVLHEDRSLTVDRAGELAGRLVASLREPFQLFDSTHHLTGSVGVVVTRDGDSEPHALLRDADLAMFRAKERGRDRYEIFDRALRAALVERLATEDALRGATGRGELVLHYQPIVRLDTGRIVGAEALVRWQHPSRGLLPPGAFLGVAEDTGMINEIGAWVLQRACGDLDRFPGLFLTVNLSGRQIAAPGVEHLVQQALRTVDDPSRIVLEITESVLMDDIEHADRVIGLLRKLGVRLAIDDFGTGFSSLAYLTRFPVDLLKIDRSFVAGMDSGRRDAAIVTAVVQLAGALGLQTVGEGVETRSEAQALARVGCELAQGWHFGRPMLPDRLDEFVAADSAGHDPQDRP